jgi:hypothetical protein
MDSFFGICRHESLLILRLTSLLAANYVYVGTYEFKKGNEGSNRTLSATKSKLQRNCPPFAAKYVKHARIS